MSKRTKQLLTGLGIEADYDERHGTSYRPTSKTAHKAPVIVKTFIDEAGQRMYECKPHPGRSEPRIFIADTYDRLFIPAHRRKLHSKAFTGPTKRYRQFVK